MTERSSTSPANSHPQSGTKKCDRCQQLSQILYRIQFDRSRAWIFVCPECWQACSRDNPDYCYGGTWKQRKK